MEDQKQNLEYVKNFFLNSNIEINITNFIIAILVSAILAFLIKKVYIYSSQTLSNKEYFSDLFIPLSIITCLVITVIKFSLALSLGLVGALSIVRFRAAIKEPEELIYLFLIIGIGLAAGANQFLVAIIATVFISLILIVLSKFRRDKNSDLKNLSSNVIHFEIKNKKIKFEKIIEVLKKNCSHINLKSSNISNDSETYIFWVEIKNKSSLINSINNLKKISTGGLNIYMYTNDNFHE